MLNKKNCLVISINLICKYFFYGLILLSSLSCTPNEEEVYTALVNGNFASMDRYIKRGVSINEKVNGIYPIFIAIDKNDIETVSYLIKEDVDINEVLDSEDNSPLLFSIKRGYDDISILLLDNGADPNIYFDDVYPLANRIAIDNNRILLKAIIDNGYNLNWQYKDDYSTLLYALVNLSTPDFFEYVLQRDSNLELKDNDNRTVLSYAIYRDKVDHILLLFENGADPNYIGYKDTSIWDDIAYYLEEDSVSVAEKSFEYGAVIDNSRSNGLKAAVFEGKHELLEWLLENGADPTISDSEGKLPIDYYWWYPHHADEPTDPKKLAISSRMVKILMDFGSRPPR
jgi:ankyrin repeat protein